jgi:ATP-binding cassette subfamily B protein
MSINRQILSIYWQHARKYKKQLLTIYPLMVVAQLMEDFLAPLLVSGILNKIASNNIDELKGNNIWLIFLAIVALEAAAHLIWNFIIRKFWSTQDQIMFDLNITAFKHLQKMSFRFFSDRFAGSLVNQVNKFVGSFERLTDPLTWNVFKLLVSLVLTFIILVPQIPIVAFAIVLIAVIYAPLIWYVRKKQIPYTTKWAAAETKRTGQLADTVSNIVAVKSFSNEELENTFMYDRATDVRNRSLDTMSISLNQELGTGAVQRSINIMVIILSVLLAVQGIIEVGTIYLALTFTVAIMRRLWDLNNTFRSFTRVFGDARDMAEILQIPPEVEDPVNPRSFKPSNGEITFENVTFHYKEDSVDKALFKKLNLSIKNGEKIGLVGPSGGGKTTITKLLLRFMDIQEGIINIDGIDISSVAQQDLRKYISYVPQEPLLFHRSITDNISYGNVAASKKEIQMAASKAHADEFISQLPEGYDTLVGERGVKLSGGQKQRIAIARAMLKDAPILVLDEATSALDSESEQLIQDALWKLMAGKTAIVIAHRLSTIQKMDRIIVLDNGKIVEEGTHKELAKKKNGLYARLWNHQSGGFLQD